MVALSTFITQSTVQYICSVMWTSVVGMKISPATHFIYHPLCCVCRTRTYKLPVLSLGINRDVQNTDIGQQFDCNVSPQKQCPVYSGPSSLWTVFAGTKFSSWTWFQSKLPWARSANFPGRAGLFSAGKPRRCFSLKIIFLQHNRIPFTSIVFWGGGRNLGSGKLKLSARPDTSNRKNILLQFGWIYLLRFCMFSGTAPVYLLTLHVIVCVLLRRWGHCGSEPWQQLQGGRRAMMRSFNRQD